MLRRKWIVFKEKWNLRSKMALIEWMTFLTYHTNVFSLATTELHVGVWTMNGCKQFTNPVYQFKKKVKTFTDSCWDVCHHCIYFKLQRCYFSTFYMLNSACYSFFFYIPWLRWECRVYFGIDINWYIKHLDSVWIHYLWSFIPISFYFIKFVGIQPTFDLFWFTIYIKNVIKIYRFYHEKWTDFIVYTARFIICHLCHKLGMTLFYW